MIDRAPRQIIVAADFAMLGTITSKLFPEYTRHILIILSAVTPLPPGELRIRVRPDERSIDWRMPSIAAASLSSIITSCTNEV